jgi:murein DD-endopeptidase MepM/ murein hydrolase activator NlpD
MRWIYLLFFFGPVGLAQVLPDGIDTVPFICEVPTDLPAPATAAEQAQAEQRQRYRVVLPAYLTAMPETPISQILMPVEGIAISQVADTWGGPRSGGRSHEGQDIFAPEDSPIYSGTEGYIYRIAANIRGGNTVVVVTNAGWRIYYAHLSSYAADIQEGQFVTTETLLGYVGNTGNALSTPPHLHLGIYIGQEDACDWHATNPLPYLINRD